jgi:ABC-type maltose transport system permease subunit
MGDRKKTPLVVFMVFQRYLVEGVATTGLKG